MRLAVGGCCASTAALQLPTGLPVGVRWRAGRVRQDRNQPAVTAVLDGSSRIPTSGPTEKVSPMGRRLVSIAVLTIVLSAVGAVMAASGALADEKTATFTIQLSGAAEVCPTAPGTCGGPGTGTATITIDRNARTLCYAITTSNVALPLVAAHIHVAPVGEAGDVVIPLFTQPVNAATVGPTCLTDLDKNLLKAIIRNPENYYVNVHNTPFPNGAVRGQLA